MSRADRLIGMARSLAIYHAIPWRQRGMRRLYAGFVKAGDLVFDIGAHVGNRTRGFAALGCRVMALEPQPDFARLLRTVFGRSPRVEIVEAAVGAMAGKASLSISDRTPTVTTVVTGWRDARSREADFGGVRWNRRIDVEMTTLDELIARWGLPAFVKIDVEGARARRAGRADAARAGAVVRVRAGGAGRGARLRGSAGRARAVFLQLVSRRIVPAGVGVMAERGRADVEPGRAARPAAIRRRLRTAQPVNRSGRAGVYGYAHDLIHRSHNEPCFDCLLRARAGGVGRSRPAAAARARGHRRSAFSATTRR